MTRGGSRDPDSSPPGCGWRALSRLVPAGRRDEVRGDLVDLFHAARAELGERAARRRCRRELLLIVVWQVGEAAASGLADLGRLASPRPLLDAVARDLGLAVRGATRRPQLAAVAVISLALGIGVSVAVFTVLNAAMLRPLGVPGEERLVFLGRPTLTFEQQRTLRESLPLDAAAYRFVPGVELGDEPGSVPAEVVSAGYFATLGLSPAMGRWFEPSSELDQGLEREIAVSHDLWRGRLGSDPGAVGRSLRLGATPARVAAVAPRGFRGLTPHFPVDVWILASERRELELRSTDWEVVARAPEGSAPGETSAILETAVGGLEGIGADTRVSALDRPRLLRMMWLIAGGIMVLPGLVLLAACANVTGLLAARGEERRGEMALRRALGASRSRLVAQLLAEGCVLAAAGSMLGLAVARWIVDGLAPWLLPLLAGYSLHPDLGLEWRAVAAASLAGAFAALASSLLPAWSGARADLTPLLGNRPSAWSAGRRRFVFRELLVLAQLVVTFAFVATAGVCIRGLGRPAAAAFPFDPERILFATIVRGEGSAGRELLARVAERVARVAGVRGVSLASVPPAAVPPAVPVRTAGDGEARSAHLNRVQASYFAIAGSELLRGRLLDAADVERDRAVAVVSVSAARELWRDGEALGRSLWVAEGSAPFEVVGIVADPAEVAGSLGAGRRPGAVVYAPLGAKALTGADHVSLVMETSGPAAQLKGEVVRAPLDLAPQVAVVGARTVAELDRAGRVHAEVTAVLSALLGLLSALLGAMGLYAAVAHLVVRRRREIGVRMTLGATPAAVRGMVLRRGAALALLGTVLGVPAALAATRVLATGVAGLPGLDGVSLAGAAALMAGAALAACYVPARRATRVDPASTLRAQ